jgi:uncharacterized membrane protein
MPATSTSEIPPGWDYNPSSWGQRLPLVLIAVLGFGIASWLGLYQLKVVNGVWEPFFGKGTVRVLNSPISEVLPVPDAVLGAFGYFLDAVSGVIGRQERWRSMPWMVILFGIAIGPLGIVSVFLVIAQPVLVSAWCTLCLVTAVLSIVMIGPAMDEVLASLQYLQRVRRKGQSVSKAFWGKQPVNL